MKVGEGIKADIINAGKLEMKIDLSGVKQDIKDLESHLESLADMVGRLNKGGIEIDLKITIDSERLMENAEVVPQE